MTTATAADAGTITIGGDLTVNRLGYGAMRLTGPNIWGEPQDEAEARRVLNRLPELGIDFVDTADAYGPNINERMIGEELHPYDGLTVATKGGQVRNAQGGWVPVGRPAYLRQCVLLSMRRLGLEQLDLWQLHRIDPEESRDAQFEEIAKMQQEGLIRHVGLSEVSVAEIEAAQKFFPVASVQNLYNLVNRKSGDVLDFCEAEEIVFIPWFPLAAGSLANEGSVLDEVAGELDATPAQVALAWVLHRSPVMLPIPGTSKVAHLEENVAAASISLSDEQFERLDKVGRAEWEKEQG